MAANANSGNPQLPDDADAPPFATAHGRGCLLSVRAQPGAKQNAITGIHEGMLKIAVTAPPDQGRANAAVIDLLARRLGIAKSRIELVSGATHRHKKFLLDGVQPRELHSLLP